MLHERTVMGTSVAALITVQYNGYRRNQGAATDVQPVQKLHIHFPDCGTGNEPTCHGRQQGDGIYSGTDSTVSGVQQRTVMQSDRTDLYRGNVHRYQGEEKLEVQHKDDGVVPYYRGIHNDHHMYGRASWHMGRHHRRIPYEQGALCADIHHRNNAGTSGIGWYRTVL